MKKLIYLSGVMLLTLLLIAGTAFGGALTGDVTNSNNTNNQVNTNAPVIAPVNTNTDTNVNTFAPVNTDVNTNTNLNTNTNANTNLNTNANTNLNTNTNANLNCNTASSNLLNVVGVCNDNDVKSNSKSDADAKVNFSYTAPRELLGLPNAYGPGGLLAIPGEMIGDIRGSSLLPDFGGPWASSDINLSGLTTGNIFVKTKFVSTTADVIIWTDLTALPKELKNYKNLVYAGEVRRFVSDKKTEAIAPMYVVSDGIKSAIDDLGANVIVVALVNEDILKSLNNSFGIGAGGSGLPGPATGASGTLGFSHSGGTGKTLVRPAAIVIGYHYDKKNKGY